MSERCVWVVEAKRRSTDTWRPLALRTTKRLARSYEEYEREFGAFFDLRTKKYVCAKEGE